MASIARAVHRLQVAWPADATGYIRVGISTIGGTDTVGPGGPDLRLSGGTFDDVSAKLRSATWGRGRSEDFSAMEGGTASFALRDKDGTYNPENPASALYGIIGERLHPIRYEVSIDGGATWAGLFGGWVKSVTPEVGRRKSTVTLTCVDFYYWLERSKPIIANVGIETTGHAIGRILDAVGLYDPDMRSLDDGDLLRYGFSADGSASGTALIQGLLEAERGVFFADGFGRSVYRDRHSLLVAGSVGAISGIMRALAPGSDAERISNIVDVTITDNAGATLVTVRATDEASRARFGDAALGGISTPYVDTWEADELGAYILSQTSSTRGALRGLQIDSREASLLSHIVNRELEDVITADEAVAGTSGDYRIERLSGSVDMGTGDMQASFMLSRHTPDATALIVGSGQVGTGTLPY